VKDHPVPERYSIKDLKKCAKLNSPVRIVQVEFVTILQSGLGMEGNRLMTRNCLHLMAGVGIASLLCGASPASAQSVGAAQSFAVVGGTTVTAAGTGSIMLGDVGVSPGTSITGFPAMATVVPPFGTHSNDAAAIAAQSAVSALYTTLATTGGATVIGAELGGAALGPGIYSFSSTANIAAGTALTLSGAGTYIFQVGSAITANVGSSVLLLNGANPCNIFWQVTSAATLNGSTFAGTVVAQANVTLGVGAVLSGRALTTALGSVTLSGGNTIGSCSSPPACPLITVAPATLPIGRVGVAYSQQLTASGGTGTYVFSVASGTLPAGLTLTAGGLLSGTPTTQGSSPVTIRATDGASCPGVTTYAMVIAPSSCPVITLAPPTLPSGTLGVAYRQQITASGGTGSYVFSVASGTLPAGLTLSPGGLLSGTPTTLVSSTVTIQATDGSGCPGVITYTISIISSVPTLPPAFLVLLVMGLTGLGYVRLRRRARAN
jgi:hypothetical protein